jgi:hypothetical protein
MSMYECEWDGAQGDPWTTTVSDLLCIPVYFIPPVVLYV